MLNCYPNDFKLEVSILENKTNQIENAKFKIYYKLYF